MKAAVFYEAERLEVEDVPEPEAGSDEVVVRVLACGFCGSDVEYYYGKSPLGTPDGKGPLVLGHELCGEVVQVGALGDRYGIAEGDRVSVNPVQSCNACNMCRAGKVAFCQNLSVLGVTTNGGFAEYAKTNIAHAYKIPESLTDEQGAFVEMLSSAVYATKRAEVEPGNLAVVYGPGPVGLSMVQLLKNEGARVALVGTRDYRLEIGKALGADYVWNTRDGSSPHWVPDLAKAIEDVNGGQLADRVLVATANVDANQQAVEISGQGSIVVLMGLAGPNDSISVPLLSNLAQDKTIRFSWLYPLQWPTTIRLLESIKVDTGPIITHSASLAGIGAAIERVLQRDDEVVKTVIKP
jgi:threonine dehydrogenase-like Zn-dependent dehydrogenase